MLFIAYSMLFSCFGKWDLMCEYHQCRNGQRGPTWVSHAHGPVSWKDLANILPRSWQLGSHTLRTYSALLKTRMKPSGS